MKTLLAAAAAGLSCLFAPIAHADDMFTLCPSGLSGVVGDHTSCAFADVVESGYQRWGLHFNALSPTVGTWYQVDCDAITVPIHFLGGATNYGHRCYAGDGAEVVVW